MKVMVIMNGDMSPDDAPVPATEMFRAMGAFNRSMADAGVLVGGDGLMPTAMGQRVTLAPDGPVVEDGPFPNPEHQLSGFWILRVDTLQDAVEWMQRSPLAGSGMQIDIRRVGEAPGFGAAFTPDLMEDEEEVRGLVIANANAAAEDAVARYHARAESEGWFAGSTS